MSEIVIAYLPQSVFLQNIGKALCEIARLDQFPDLIDIDIVGVLGAVRPSAQLAVLLLLCFQAVQQFLKRRDKGQAAVAGLRLCAILLDDLALAINGYLRDRMTNGDRLFLEVDSVLLLGFVLCCKLTLIYGLVCDFCSSGQSFAHQGTFQPLKSGFLQIPPHDGHPCL